MDILEQKPFDLETATQYANELSSKYNKIYCVVTNRKINKGYEIIGIQYCSEYIHRYNVCHIAMNK